jgi:hypothetical protein
MAISVQTQKHLWARSFNVCAFVPCIQPLTLDPSAERTGSVVLGEQAHIRSPKPGGPRYDPHYKRDVDGFENLVLLCPTHHSMIDANNGRNFTVSQLEQMKAQHGRQQEMRTKFAPAISAYLSDRYGEEDLVHFRQAELQGRVDAMFVDVPLGIRTDAPASALMRKIAKSHPGDPTASDLHGGLVVTGAVQALLHPEWTGNAVVVGGPGQGKSTLLQYLSQYYRARRLNKSSYDAADKRLLRYTGPSRIPFRIDLRRYATWVRRLEDQADKEKADSSLARVDLERFLLDEISRRTGIHEFTADDFEAVFATEPVLLALDGLDEIPEVQLRERITTQIARAQDRLKSLSADLVVLVSTRPGSSLSALSTFSVLQLRPLTPGLRRQYLAKWIDVSGLTPESAKRLEEAFYSSEHLPHIQELASSPMQLAILLNLLHRRQLLPEQRTELFRDYLVTFLDREQTEDKEPLLNAHRAVLESTHAYLGWFLHSQTEAGGGDGGISREELRRLLRDHLRDQPDAQKLADDIYSAIVERVLCLVEREGRFEFEVQSLREFFAAKHLFENLTSRGAGNSRDDGATALLTRPYWTNVARFFVGMFTKGEVRSLSDNFRAAERLVGPHPLVRANAVLTLSDRVYLGQPAAVLADTVDFILAGPGVALGEKGFLDEGGIPLKLGEKSGRTQAVAHLQHRLEADAGPVDLLAACLYRHATADDDLPGWWWEKFAPTSAWLRVAAALHILADLSSANTDRLITALAAAEGEIIPVLPLLIGGGYNGSDETILRHILREQNRGVIARSGDITGDTPAALLSRYASSVSTQDRMERDRAAREGPGILSSARQAAQAILKREVSDWGNTLSLVDKTWGSGWVLHRAIAAAPTSVNLAAIRTDSYSLKAALSWENQVRTRAGDESWWREFLNDSPSALERNLRVIGLLSNAPRATLIARMSDLETAVDAMTRSEFASVSNALNSAHGVTRGRLLPLGDVVRTAQIRPSGPVLWLLRAVSTESGKELIDRHLEQQLGRIVEAGGDITEVFTLVQTKRQVSLDAIIGTLSEELPTLMRLEPVKIGRAKEILTNPERWPTKVVKTATDVVASQQGKKMLPLAKVADTDNWNLG